VCFFLPYGLNYYIILNNLKLQRFNVKVINPLLCQQTYMLGVLLN
jgi:hypothetical protein